MSGTLGMMITRYENLPHIVGIVKAARNAGHAVRIFLTDEGVRFATDPGFLDLPKMDGVDISLCEHNVDLLGIRERTEGITYGSQYNNAGIIHDSDRVLIF